MGRSYVTSVKDQKVTGPCHIFAAVSLVESMYLLEYNNGIHLNLSERHVWSHHCADNNPMSTSIRYSLGFIQKEGVVLESCLPYPNSCPSAGDCHLPPDRISSPYDCGRPKCNNSSRPNERYTIGNYEEVKISDMTTDELKKWIRYKGPLALWFNHPNHHNGSNHAYLLIGWETVNGAIRWELKDSWQGEAKFVFSNVNLPKHFKDKSYLGFNAYTLSGTKKQTWNGYSWVSPTSPKPCLDAAGDPTTCPLYEPETQTCASTPPMPGSIYEPASTVFCENMSYTFKIEPDPCAVRYEWYASSSAVKLYSSGNHTASLISGSSPGNYSVYVRAVYANGSKSSSRSRYVSIYPSSMSSCGGGYSYSSYNMSTGSMSLNLNEETPESADTPNEIRIYPVPTHGNIIFEFFLEEEGPVNLSIVDQWGKKITVIKNEKFNKGNHKKQFQLPSNTYGFHHAILQTDKGKVQRKFIITL